MSAFFWRKVHLQLTNNTSLRNNGAKYIICQVKEDNSLSKYLDHDGETNEIKIYVKESGFSYIIPIYGSTRLIVYNSSNVTSVEGRVHRGGKVVVEVPFSTFTWFFFKFKWS